jgi:hypothetical protein
MALDGRTLMLNFHETETCEGIIQHLEKREGAKRCDVRSREGNDTPPDARVEMTFRLGDKLYAIEHTGIEPFEGFMAHQNRAPQLFAPLEAAVAAELSEVLSPGVIIEMQMPIDAFDGRDMREVRAIQAALAAHVKVTAPTLPARRYFDYRGTLVAAQPAGVPFVVSLVRFDGIGTLPGRFQLKHLTRAVDEPRALRIQRTCDLKFPKLAEWKRSDEARTILVLEDNDRFNTDAAIVAKTFLPIAMARDDAPDETYLVSTYNTSRWYACPILVDSRTYFDLAEISHPIHFEMDDTGRLIET